jgi:pantoate--beta-alanine ligase
LIIETINNLRDQINRAKSLGQTIGFVPTMGALHLGHLDLVQKAKHKTDFVVVSIFVNPTQFNNPNDLIKYPKTLEADLALLENWADLVFTPSVDEMYPKAMKKTWDFGLLTSSLEGFYRPGHFDGVCTIVQKLFAAVAPHEAFFGKKDYQQLAVIKALVLKENMDLSVVGCETIRETDGLAMSSRNMRLNELQRKQALLIYQTLEGIQRQKEKLTIEQLQSWGKSQFTHSLGLELEYLEIVDAKTFEPLFSKNKDQMAVILVAAYAGEVRLIDNMELVW